MYAHNWKHFAEIIALDSAASDIQYFVVEKLELSQCVLAAPWHRRPLNLSELRVRLDGVGRKVSADVLSLTLVDLRDKLAADPWFPFALTEVGTQWALGPKHLALEALAGDGRIHPAQPLSDEELMVLSVVVFNGPMVSHALPFNRGWAWTQRQRSVTCKTKA